MDIDGVYAEMLFPPQRTMSHFLGDDDDDFVLAGVEAYNNFLFEEFCAPDPKRLDRRRADPVARHRHVDRRAAQGEGTRREGRADLELAVGRRRASRPTTTRSGPRRSTRACRSRSTSTSSAGKQRAAGRKAAAKAGNALYDMTTEADPGQGDRRHEPRVLDGRRQHHRDAVHRRVRPVPRAAGLRGSRSASAGSRTSSSALDDRYWRNRVLGRAADQASRRRSTGTATTRRRFITDRIGHRAAPPGRRSTTSCGRATTRTTATTGRTRARSSKRR